MLKSICQDAIPEHFAPFYCRNFRMASLMWRRQIMAFVTY